MSITNKIVTRGFGPAHFGSGNKAGPLTRGYGGRFVEQIVEVIQRLPHGISGRRRRDDEEQELIIWVKLVGINDDEPQKKIEGSVVIKHVRNVGRVIRSLVEFVTSRTKKIIVSVQRITGQCE